MLFAMHPGVSEGEAYALTSPAAMQRSVSLILAHPAAFSILSALTFGTVAFVQWMVASFAFLAVLQYALANPFSVSALMNALPFLALVWLIMLTVVKPIGEGAIVSATFQAAQGEVAVRRAWSAVLEVLEALIGVRLVVLAFTLLPAALVISAGFLIALAGNLFEVLMPFVLLIGAITALVGNALVGRFRAFAVPLIVRDRLAWREAMRRSAALVREARPHLRRHLLLSNAISAALPALVLGLVVLAFALALVVTPEALPQMIILALAAFGIAVAIAALAEAWTQVVRTVVFLSTVQSADQAAAQPNVTPMPAPAPSLSVATAQPASSPRSTLLPRWEAPLDQLTPGQRLSFYYEKVRRHGETAHDLNEMAAALMEIGDWWGAQSWLNRARTLDPRNADVVLNLATLHYRRRDYDAARDLLREYLRLETNPEKLARVQRSDMLRALLTDESENA